MKASEATKIAKEYHDNQKEGWEKYLEAIYEQIERAAKKGFYEIPLSWPIKVKPNSDQLIAVMDQLEEEGYRVYRNDNYVDPIRVGWGDGE